MRTMTLTDTGDLETAPSQAEVGPPGLQPRISLRWALKPRHVVIVAVGCFAWLLLSYLPLSGTELWRMVSYGNWMLAHGQIPLEDPFMPLARGMPLVVSDWLSHVAWGAVARVGTAWVSMVFATVVVGSYLLVGRSCYLITGRAVLSAALAGLALLAAWPYVSVPRASTLGFLCGVVLTWLMVGADLFGGRDEASPASSPPRWSKGLLVATPLLLAAWANLDGSFWVGLALLAAAFVGQLIEAAAGRNNAGRASGTRCLPALVLLELGALATLANPYGIDVWLAPFGLWGSGNAADLPERMPLVLRSYLGASFALSALALAAAWRLSRRPIRPADTLLLLGLGIAAALENRWLAWYGVAWALNIAPHAAALLPVWNRAPRTARDSTVPAARAFIWSVVCITLVWVTLTLAPWQRRGPQQLFGATAPLDLAVDLRKNPPDGIVYLPLAWSDWLVLYGPPGLKPWATSRLDGISRTVWRDYLLVERPDSQWEEILARYAVTTLVLDTTLHERLLATLRGATNWKLTYEDPRYVVARQQAPPAAP